MKGINKRSQPRDSEPFFQTNILQNFQTEVYMNYCLSVALNETPMRPLAKYWSPFNRHFCHILYFVCQVMHDEVSETENIRKNLSIERQIVEGCDMLLDVNQIFIRQGNVIFHVKFPLLVLITYQLWT